jgi:hypothetical protein
MVKRMARRKQLLKDPLKSGGSEIAIQHGRRIGLRGVGQGNAALPYSTLDRCYEHFP